MVRTNPIILQENHYYAYGSAIPKLSTANGGERYTYNGIELVEDFNINLHLADYRAYDAITGRWTGVDPKPNPSLSTYAGMGCNPVNYADSRGDTVYTFRNDGLYLKLVNTNRANAIGGILRSGIDNVPDVVEDPSLYYETLFKFNDLYTEDREHIVAKKMQVTYFSEQQINDALEYSGVNDSKNQSLMNRYSYAQREGVKEGLMDYNVRLNTSYGDKIIVVKTSDGSVGYNLYDLGNFLWGMGMKRLGFSYLVTKGASEYVAWRYAKKWYNTPGQKPFDEMGWFEKKTWTGDALGDQQAIYDGYYYPNGFKSVFCTVVPLNQFLKYQFY